MIRPVVRDVFFLRQKSEPATQGDLSIGQDLRDTLASNRDRCVGIMAARRVPVFKPGKSLKESVSSFSSANMTNVDKMV